MWFASRCAAVATQSMLRWRRAFFCSRCPASAEVPRTQTRQSGTGIELRSDGSLRLLTCSERTPTPKMTPPSGTDCSVVPPQSLGVPLDMSRIQPECPDSDPSDRSVPADVLRQQPEEEEDEGEDEGDGKEDDDDDDKDDDGYSE